MSDKTKIEWTDATWNPLRGCSRVSEGCRNCYAERVAARFSGPGLPYEGLTTPAGNWNGKVKLVEDHLTDPLKWKKPRKIFVNSMSDLFHESVPFDWIDRIFAVMREARHHTFQVLTKRPERMAEYVGAERKRVIWNRLLDVSGAAPLWPLPNVWLGVSVEDQPSADKRIQELLRCHAAVRWLSVEPMLGPVDLWVDGLWCKACPHCEESGHHCPETGAWECRACDGTQKSNEVAIDWVVCGGGERPMHPDWVRSLRDQCVNAGVPFFFKQWGEWCPATKYYARGLARRPHARWPHLGRVPAGGESMSEPKYYPILFTGPMVRSILDGRKAQTRRMVKPQPEYGRAYWGGAVDDVNVFRIRNKTGGWHHCDPLTFAEVYSPYGQPGDRLWVRETACIAPKNFATPDGTCLKDYDGDLRYVSYKADNHCEDAMRDYRLKWTPSILVPRWASRITLEITGVRVERVQDISEEDAIAEGVEPNWDGDLKDWDPEEHGYRSYCQHYPNGCECFPVYTARESFLNLFYGLRKRAPKDENPWVWVIEFKKIEHTPRQRLGGA